MSRCTGWCCWFAWLLVIVERLQYSGLCDVKNGMGTNVNWVCERISSVSNRLTHGNCSQSEYNSYDMIWVMLCC